MLYSIVHIPKINVVDYDLVFRVFSQRFIKKSTRLEKIYIYNEKQFLLKNIQITSHIKGKKDKDTRLYSQ